MAHINLLPWREELRERKNKEFLSLFIVSLLLGIAVAFATWTFFNNTLSEQRLANGLISSENAKLDSQLKEIAVLEQRREDIISRMRLIQDLQGKRSLPVRVWDDVAKAIPAAMYLTTFSRVDDILTFKGRADNPNIVSSLVRNLDASQWLGNSKVVSIRQNIDVYQAVPSVTTDNNNVYPESSYINFEVTSQVIPDPVETRSEDTENAANNSSKTGDE